MKPDRARTELSKKLLHDFRNPALLEEALRHASVTGRSNERLEFLGDRVLGLVMADALLRQHPEAREGELAKRYSALVSRKSCAGVSRHLNLADFLVRDPQNANIAQSGNVMANLCEAVIAALYLDGGLEAAERFILSAWLPIMEEMTDIPANPKSELQEFAGQSGLGVPAYQVTDTSGPDHAPIITVEVSLPDGSKAQAGADSKKKAEQAAAQRLLEKLSGSRKEGKA